MRPDERTPSPAALLMSGDDYRESLRRYRPTCSSTAAQWPAWPTSPPSRPASTPSRSPTTSRWSPLRAVDDGGAAHQRQARQPADPHRHERGDLLNKLEAVRLVCQETGCAQRYLTHDALNAIGQVSARIDDAHGTQRAHGALPGLPAPRAGPGPDAGRRHDGRQGRPQPAPARAGQRRQLCAHRRAQCEGHRHLRHQGHRHRRALHARVAGHALPQHGAGRRRLRGLLRGAHRCAGPDHRRAPGRPARREGGAWRSAVFAQVRPEHRRVHVRSRARALGQRVLRRRVGTQRPPHVQLRDAPPAYLHRGAGRLWRPAHRRRRADVRGERVRPRARRPTCASRWWS